jgi:Zn-dependent alcohol dehydrogenase
MSSPCRRGRRRLNIISRRLAARAVIAVDMVEAKLAVAKQFGATDIVNAGDTDR